MTYKQIENQYWETFDINQGTDKINGYPVIKISDTYSRPATVEDFESFLKQSFIKYLKDEVEETKAMIAHTPDEVAKLNQHLPSTLQRATYSEAVGYCKAISDQITHITNQIKELEV